LPPTKLRILHSGRIFSQKVRHPWHILKLWPMAQCAENMHPSSIQRNGLEGETELHLDPLIVIGLSELSISSIWCDISTQKEEGVKRFSAVLVWIKNLSLVVSRDCVPRHPSYTFRQ
jgi:hypothetical protein